MRTLEQRRCHIEGYLCTKPIYTFFCSYRCRHRLGDDNSVCESKFDYQIIFVEGSETTRISASWLLIGDFNSVIHGHERSSGKGVSSSFLDMVQCRGLLDLGFAGPKFTWNHENNIEQRVSAQLDKGFCDAY